MQEELPATIFMYERLGYFDEVLSLLEGGLSLERAHVGVLISHPRTILNISADGDLHRTRRVIQQVPTRKMFVHMQTLRSYCS